MNKWKIGLLICFVTLLVTIGLGLYAMLDQGVTLTYMRQSYDEMDSDLKRLTKIINDTDMTRNDIDRLLAADKDSVVVITRGDTLFVGRLILTFEKDTLVNVKRQP